LKMSTFNLYGSFLSDGPTGLRARGLDAYAPAHCEAPNAGHDPQTELFNA